MITLKKQHRRYDKYQTSEVEWLRNIPSNWNIKPAFSLVEENIKMNEKGEETNVLSLSYGNIIIRDVSDNYGLLPESFNTYQIVNPGNIILRLTDLQNDQVSLRVGYSNNKGIITSAYVGLIPKEGLLGKYLYYLLHAYDLHKVFYSMGGGVRQGMNFADIKRLPLLLPSLDEQRSIASYLDEKCALIDRIIEGKKKQIEILEEQRAAIINRAVTKGLDENMEMKESGVEWIGQMPELWDIKKLKTVFRFEKGKKAGLFTKEYVSDQKNIGEYPVYSGQTEDEGVMGRINSYIYDLDDTIFTTTVGAKVMTPMVIGGKFSLSQNCVLFIKQDKKIDVRYFYYQLFPMFKWEKDSIPSHMQPSLRVSDLNKYSIAFPIYEEQVKIASYIEEKTKFIDKFSKEIESSISLLNEYKTSLISHAVTGKIKVPTSDDV